MTRAPISDDIALRIALAARALPDIGAARLVRVVEDAVGLPPTAQKLGRLDAKNLKRALGGELEDMDAGTMTKAIAILKGESLADTGLPPVQSYAEGDMPGSIRVACASNEGELLDGHFASAARFLIYQVSSAQHRLIDVRVPNDAGTRDRNASRARLIADCQLLYVASIGGPAAAKVIKADIHPIKDPKGGSARERIRALQKVLGDKPPPWLAKVMGHHAEERVRFEHRESDV